MAAHEAGNDTGVLSTPAQQPLSTEDLLREEVAAALPETELKRLLGELREGREEGNLHLMHNTYQKDGGK